ncbi:MAG: DUF3160 domain-containing protein, partial [Rhodothermales bacterium]|nr:DUF3160 domain-containing protein [Rhodothermales bacterium]
MNTQSSWPRKRLGAWRTSRGFPMAVALAVLVPFVAARAQDRPFSIEQYSAFLAANAAVEASELLEMHPAGVFAADIDGMYDAALYSQTIDDFYHLTDYEKSVLRRQGFVVTERVQPASFGEAFMQIYDRDLPVFLSTDAILHAFHMSYDLILEGVEEAVVIPRLGQLLGRLHGVYFMAPWNQDPTIHDIDVDLYLSVARSLLHGGPVETAFA